MGYSPWGHKESDMTEQLHFTSSCNTTCLGYTNWENDVCDRRHHYLTLAPLRVWTCIKKQGEEEEKKWGRKKKGQKEKRCDSQES